MYCRPNKGYLEDRLYFVFSVTDFNSKYEQRTQSVHIYLQIVSPVYMCILYSEVKLKEFEFNVSNIQNMFNAIVDM